MKEIKMDWKTYQEELHSSNIKGYREGISETVRLLREILAGADKDTIYHSFEIEGDAEKMAKAYRDIKSLLNLSQETSK